VASIEDFGNHETSWCPGCGNFAILKAMKQAMSEEGLKPHQVLVVSGIGQAAKAPHYLNVNMFNGLHGRAFPVAGAAKIANDDLAVFIMSGDGCSYSEGGNHFLHAIRRNINVTMLVHDNQIYGLTQGQASPTSKQGTVTKAQPLGSASTALNPIALAVSMNAGFVARGFSGNIGHLTRLIREAHNHNGFALVDILQPCVSFNKVNTHAWYKDRCYELDNSYDPHDWDGAIQKSREWGEKIPLGIIYKKEGPSFADQIPNLQNGNLIDQRIKKKDLKEVFGSFV
jgi:2-oxoglutarate/2-oxoacid ferredoxin oxidoreductase subunit beta